MTRYGLVLAVVLALGFSTFGGDFLRPFVKTLPSLLGPYTTSILMSLLDVVIFVGLITLFGASRAEIWRATGIPMPWRAPALMATIAIMAPALFGLFFLKISQESGWLDYLWLAVGSPFIEEVVFRGLALGVLIRLCGVPFWAAIGFPALLFGIAHFAYEEDLINALSIVAVTGLGGLYFGWLYVQWGGNIWPPFLLHTGMNGLFQVFVIGDDATLGLAGNILRAAIILISIGLSVWATAWLTKVTHDPRPLSLLVRKPPG